MSSYNQDTIQAGIMGGKVEQDVEQDAQSRSRTAKFLNLSMVTHNSLNLWGNSLLGQIANAQAALNHTGLLDLSTMFVMSDVVDAVNYKNGDATPIFDGLMKRAADHLAEGELLANSPATGRIMPRLTQYWISQGYEERHGQMPTMLDNTDWIIDAVSATGNVLAEMDERLRYRMLRANGPVSGLLDICSQSAYRTAHVYDGGRRSRWANFMQERGKAWTAMSRSGAAPGVMYKLEQQFDAEWQAKSRRVQEMLTREFLELARDYISQGGTAHIPGSFLNTYQQMEAVKGSRWRTGRPLNLQPILDMIISDEELLVSEVDAWARQPGVDDTLLVLTRGATGPPPERISGIDRLWAKSGDILEWDGNMLGQFIIQDRFSSNMLNVARYTGESKWQYAGVVGGDSSVLVLIASC